ncbi:MAG: efflux RND transporter periplasmic adaptor subunit [Bacteroidetes bacterium]|jgi:membrane fusion protein (multidrug efflux system)|nr:efflux RND transporter periplasmic adaptor subunit [Bacteroidota bacterium]MBK7588778.1 efflux RND transporter periplasmic adaptor subunit [Bacteroidota bacterium]MBK9483214.1 efflux RND transporter periplasmic adaptor subunit [Bacteroidota bacterium]
MKLRTIIILVILIAVLVLVKIFFLSDHKEEAPKANAPKGQKVNVTGYIAHEELLENKIYSSGSIMANEEVVLHPEVSGKLVSIHFKEGSFVAKGALLAKINDADLQAQLKRLGFQLKLAKEKSERLKGLLDIQGVSRQEYDEGASQLQLISADMDYTRAQIAKTEIRAPFAGKIGLRQVSAGSYVTNATTLATIQQNNVLKVDFTIPEKYADIVHIGDKVQFTVDNTTAQSFATVYAIEPKIDAETRNITVRALCSNIQQGIYPGAFARIELVAQKKQSTIMIPTEAIIPELKGKKVFVSRNGKAMPVMVQTGIRTDAKVEIVSGLSAGDTVVVTGIMSLKPEANINIVGITQ